MGIELFSSDSSEVAHETATWEQDGIARCCECGELFPISELQGSFMARFCPLCGKRLHEGAYDAHARDVAWRLRRAERGSARAHAFADELERLALARYLTSEWYLLTGTPTSAVGHNATQEVYSFTPAYDEFGKFFLQGNHGKSEVRGIRGEFVLFESLRSYVRDLSSYLFGSMIIPSIELPTDRIDDRGGLHTSRNQTDCVVLTRQGAFVLEVKNWHAKINADVPQRRVEVTRKWRTWEYCWDEGPIKQALGSREALIEHCPELNPDRVCGAVVFVDPIEMTGRVGNLPCINNVYFGWLKTDGENSILRKMGRCIKFWKTRPDGNIHGNLADMAARLLSEYSCHELPINPLGRM